MFDCGIFTIAQVGHLHALSQQVDGLMVRNPGEKGQVQLAALGVAAGWRLGRWSALPGYLERTRLPSSGGAEGGGVGGGSGVQLSQQDQWAVYVGKLLLALHQGRIMSRRRRSHRIIFTCRIEGID